MTGIPRLRMFAGPNGSGKSTIQSVIRPELLGVTINPDELEKDIARFGFLDLNDYGIDTTAEEILGYFRKYRAYIFDNSSHSKVWLAEVIEGKKLSVKADRMPAWFKTSLWDKFGDESGT